MKKNKMKPVTYLSEKEFLEAVSSNYTPTELSPQDRVMRDLSVATFKPYIKGGLGLELGCSDGYMTQLLAELVENLEVVDGSSYFIGEAKSRELPNVKYIHSLFEEFHSDREYDYIFASYVLEHVNQPQELLKMVRAQLKPGGKFFVVVPNARALSRQLALHMGILESLYDLTENDLKHGHRRVYDRNTLNRELAEAGLKSISQGGIFLKLLADFQMDQLLNNAILEDSQINGLYSLGLEYPDLCGSLFSICVSQ